MPNVTTRSWYSYFIFSKKNALCISTLWMQRSLMSCAVFSTLLRGYVLMLLLTIAWMLLGHWCVSLWLYHIYVLALLWFMGILLLK